MDLQLDESIRKRRSNLVAGHQGPTDAAFSGLVTIVATGVFTAVRHRVPFREPGARLKRHTARRAGKDLAECPRRDLLVRLGGISAFVVLRSV